MTVSTVTDNASHLTVTWEALVKPENWRSWRIYAKRSISNGWVSLYETFNDTEEDISVDIYQFLDGVEGDYAVAYTTQALGAPVQVENDFGDSAVTVTPGGDGHYWIIDSEDPANNFRLEHVSNFPLDDEWEQETYHLIGRGRKHDVGDRIGWQGTITGTLHDTPESSAVEQRLRLEGLRRNSTAYFLRSPFGRTFQVAVMDLNFAPSAGVGPREVHTRWTGRVEELGGVTNI